MWRHNKKAAIYKPRREASTEASSDNITPSAFGFFLLGARLPPPAMDLGSQYWFRSEDEKGGFLKFLIWVTRLSLPLFHSWFFFVVGLLYKYWAAPLMIRLPILCLRTPWSIKHLHSSMQVKLPGRPSPLARWLWPPSLLAFKCFLLVSVFCGRALSLALWPPLKL